MRIVNTCKYAHLPDEHPAVQRVLAKAEFVTCEKAKLTSEELLEFVQGADALISGTDFIRADLIEKFPKSLKVISRPAVGFDRVDIAAARAQDILSWTGNIPATRCK
jgi:lactate dehydrogenase-like 2-hydroxyacid dehydrogenase